MWTAAVPSISRRAFVAGALALPAAGGMARADQPSIRDAAGAHGFRFGAAVIAADVAGPDGPSSPPRNPALAALLARSCDLVTPEVEMKMKAVRPREDAEEFGPADAIVNWARDNGVLVRAHTPVFTGSGMPGWLDEIAAADPLRATEIVLDYVETLAARYADATASIDVVNEAIAPDGQGLRHHWLYDFAGAHAIADAFLRARAAAPEAELVYNDWILPYDDPEGEGDGMVSHPARRAALLDLLDQCLACGAPIDTVGIQSHLQHRPDRQVDYAAWHDYLHDFEARGVTIAITELDAPDCRVTGDANARDEAIGAAVGAYLAATLEATSIRNIVCWGLADARSQYGQPDARPNWCPIDGAIRALPYGPDLRRKPMADAIVRAMQEAPARAG